MRPTWERMRQFSTVSCAWWVMVRFWQCTESGGRVKGLSSRTYGSNEQFCREVERLARNATPNSQLDIPMNHSM
ncbi:hypothetical protein C8Q80DRAFT_1158591 [Daedaleopsis nitida]|nr:hypothetical protein C8Q80DRAFT_1158591 [Daedaleopsis nitida]